MNFLSKIFLTAWMAIGSIFGYQDLQQQPVSYGAFNPTGGATYRLQSSVSSTQTTITLSSFKEPVSNIPYTMSYLNSDIMYGTINPQNNNNKEFVSFTGITQNANGSATLTGVTRGLGFSYPYTASTTLRQAHSGQSIFILSNTPQLYNQYANKNNDQSISAIWDFSTYLPITSISATSSNQFTNKAYVDSVAIAGAPNSTESVKGITELATQSEMSSSALIGGTGASLSLYSKYSTSSPAFTTGNYIPITRSSDNKLSPLFIATSSTDAYTFAGPMSFASSTFTATTTIAASSLTNGAFRLNGLAYIFPSSRGVSGSLLTENGSGTLSWSPITIPRYTYATTSIGLGVTNGFATSSANFVIPANVITASSTISFKGNFTCDNSSNGDRSCIVYLKNSSGQTLTAIDVGTDQANSQQYGFDVTISNLAGTSNWSGIGHAVNYTNLRGIGSVGGAEVDTTSTISLSSGATFVVVVQSAGTLTTATLRNYSIIVNP